MHSAGNYLSVDVRDISVSAINTMKGGSAVATSNIIIEPVQIIVCPSEVMQKLSDAAVRRPSSIYSHGSYKMPIFNFLISVDVDRLSRNLILCGLLFFIKIQ